MIKPQLFLIPFAGGNCYSFNFLMPHLKEFQIIPLELPGRGKRIKEVLLTEFDQAADDIFKQILNNLTSSTFLIYGHSLGTGLGLRVSNMLEKIDRKPLHLIFTGNPGPGIKEIKLLYQLERSKFINEIRKLGGLPEELSLNDEFIDYIEPVFRADFELAERNRLVEEIAVNTPIYAIMGDLEKDSIHINNWKKYTNAKFQYQIFSGDHFFIHQHPKKIASIIQKCLNKKLHHSDL